MKFKQKKYITIAVIVFVVTALFFGAYSYFASTNKLQVVNSGGKCNDETTCIAFVKRSQQGMKQLADIWQNKFLDEGFVVVGDRPDSDYDVDWLPNGVNEADVIGDPKVLSIMGELKKNGWDNYYKQEGQMVFTNRVAKGVKEGSSDSLLDTCPVDDVLSVYYRMNPSIIKDDYRLPEKSVQIDDSEWYVSLSSEQHYSCKRHT